MRTIKIGEYYKHFKNTTYVIKDIVNDCDTINEDPFDKVVIYQALYGDRLVWARKYDDFIAEVDHIKHPDVNQKYKFKKIKLSCNEYLIKLLLIPNYKINYSIKAIDNFVSNMNNLNIDTSIISKKDYDNREEISDKLFSMIEKSNLIIIDYKENDIKLSILIEHARCNNIPVYIIIKKGTMLPSFMNKLAKKVIQYSELNDVYKIISKLKKR